MYYAEHGFSQHGARAGTVTTAEWLGERQSELACTCQEHRMF